MIEASVREMTLGLTVSRCGCGPLLTEQPMIGINLADLAKALTFDASAKIQSKSIGLQF
jgi:hypothetical protein